MANDSCGFAFWQCCLMLVVILGTTSFILIYAYIRSQPKVTTKKPEAKPETKKSNTVFNVNCRSDRDCIKATRVCLNQICVCKDADSPPQSGFCLGEICSNEADCKELMGVCTDRKCACEANKKPKGGKCAGSRLLYLKLQQPILNDELIVRSDGNFKVKETTLQTANTTNRSKAIEKQANSESDSTGELIGSKCANDQGCRQDLHMVCLESECRCKPRYIYKDKQCFQNENPKTFKQ